MPNTNLRSVEEEEEEEMSSLNALQTLHELRNFKLNQSLLNYIILNACRVFPCVNETALRRKRQKNTAGR
jgi:hypothetical protein